MYPQQRIQNCVKLSTAITGAVVSCSWPNFKRREGLGTSLQIIGLVTIDPHSHAVQTLKLYKCPTFGVNQASFD